MAVYVELVSEDLGSRFRNNLLKDSGGRAGVRNVRRPLRGMEIKEDTYAVFRVIGADGSEIKLVDSSWREGEGRGYANFLLQSVQEARMERQQIIETFGSSMVFFFGESPRFIDVSAVLLNSHDFQWEGEWWRNYEDTMRGTRLAEMGAKAYLFFDDTILEGYPMNATTVKESQNNLMVQLQFRMFVTNRADVSQVGSPDFPVHAEATIPQATSQRDDRTFAFELETPKEAAQRVFIDYLKHLGASQIQQEIAKAKNLEQVQALQRQYALDQLGLVPEGANLLSMGKSYFQGVLGAIRGDNETVDQANQRLRAEAKKMLSLSAGGSGIDALKLLYQNRPMAALDAVSNRSAGGGYPSMAEALRTAIIQSASYPSQNLEAFAANAARVVYPGGVRQLLEMKRTLPYRSQIRDNYDEYTATSESEAADIINQRVGLPVGGDVPNLPQAISTAIQNKGGKPTPDSLYKMGVVKWTPGEGFSVDKTGLNASNPAGDPQALGTGSGYEYTYSKSWGSTPQAGGASGGGMGGGVGSGLGGKAQDPTALVKAQGSLSLGSPYGGPDVNTPGYYNGGLAPDGTPVDVVKWVWGPTPGGSSYGGGPAADAVANLPDSEKGKGVFVIQVFAGKMP